MTPADDAACAACGRPGPLVFLDQQPVPTNSCVLLDSRDEATGYPTGRLRLAVCAACGFIGNLAFDAALTTYSSAYEETQGFSPRFRAFARDLAQRWVDRHGLRGGHVLEIGCGKGEFLALLCELGGNRGTGIDPAYVPGRLDSPAMDRMTFHRDFYDAAWGRLDADAVVCRHTLEHVGDVRGFLAAVRAGVGERDLPVLFELPDVGRVLRENAFWDLYYEHCSYFTPGSLARLFGQEGFAVTDLELDFDDQYILLEARPAPPEGPSSAPLPLEEAPEDVVAEVEGFVGRHDADLQRRRRELADLAEAGARVVVWGAGSKGVAWLTTMGDAGVAYAVDVNPFKQDKYMAGTGHRVVGPQHLPSEPPDVVFVMNPVYTDEIADELARLGVDAELRPA